MSSIQKRVTAKTISQKIRIKNIIKEHVTNIIKRIEADAIIASENHQLSCFIQIPSFFDIPGLSNKTAQLYIYTQLIMDLEEKGFKVKIDTNTNIWEISGWSFEIDIKLSEKYLQFIAEHSKKTP